MTAISQIKDDLPECITNSLITEYFNESTFNLYSEVFVTIDDLKENKINFERI